MLPLGQCLSFLAIEDITEQTAKRCGFIFENSFFLGLGSEVGSDVGSEVGSDPKLFAQGNENRLTKWCLGLVLDQCESTWD